MMLLSPGPTYIPKEILEAQTKEMITHRSEEFSKLYEDLCIRMRNYLNAKEAHIITGSGTLGLEALIANIVKRDEEMLCLANGVFGDKLELTAKIYTKTQKHSLEAGKGWDLEKSKEIIDLSSAQVFGMVYNETGYGVRNHSKEIIKYAKKKGMYTILDCISAWPGTPIDMKEFRLDGFVTGSQKGLACPPGLAPIGLSTEAIERIESREGLGAHDIDIRRYRKRFEKDRQTPNTPAISLMYAMQKSLDILDKQGGIEGAVNQHIHLSEYSRKRIRELGFELIAEPGFESYTLTSFKVKGNAERIRKELRERYKIVIVGCKGVFAEEGLRVAHMGYITKEMLNEFFESLKKVIK